MAQQRQQQQRQEGQRRQPRGPRAGRHGGGDPGPVILGAVVGAAAPCWEHVENSEQADRVLRARLQALLEGPADDALYSSHCRSGASHAIAALYSFCTRCCGALAVVGALVDRQSTRTHTRTLLQRAGRPRGRKVQQLRDADVRRGASAAAWIRSSLPTSRERRRGGTD